MREPDHQDLDYIPFSPVERGEGSEDEVIETAVHSALREAKKDGRSGSQAGHKAQSSGLPAANLEQGPALGFFYLKDLIPDMGSLPRMINLHTTDENSSGMSITLAYPELGPGEVFPEALPDPPWNGLVAPARDHAAWLRFGAGGAQHHVEFDCGEGNIINVPGATVEVTLVDWTFYRNTTTFYGVPPKLTSYAHCSAAPVPGHAIFTTRVMTYYQVDLDLLVPPTIEGFLARLLDALTTRTLID